MGKLIVIDGLDGTGKATQVSLMKEYITDYIELEPGKSYREHINFETVDFPRYGMPSCKLVENYLHGKFGTNPSDVNPELASLFYTFDRVESYVSEKWGQTYDDGGLIIADRYTTSNVIHQGSKIIDAYVQSINPKYSIMFDGEYSHDTLMIFGTFVNNLYYKEYENYKLPKPDAVIFLKTSKEKNEEMLRNFDPDEKVKVSGDIHESNTSYLDSCRRTLDIYQYFIENKSYLNFPYLCKLMRTMNHHFVDVTTISDTHDRIRKIVEMYV